jgi:hypothetical protein
VLAIVGAAAAVASGRFFLASWMFAEVLVEPHQSPNFVHVPVALLVGFAAGAVIAPAWRQLRPERRDEGAVLLGGSAARRSRLRTTYWWLSAGLLAAYLLVITLFSDLNERGQLDHMEPLAGDQRELMAWVDTNVPAGSPILVVTGFSWWGDPISEWFPALTRAHSVFTVQGAEWLGDAFNDRMEGHGELQECGEEDVECLDEVAKEHEVQFDYVYLASRCCDELAESLRDSSAYRIVHEDAGGIVAEHLR